MRVSQAGKKGGAGKTIMTLSLGYESARRGFNTLIIDADPNQAVITWRGARSNNDIELPKNITIISRPDNALHKDISKLSKGFDNVFIDCPPQDNVITNSAMLASDFVLMPCAPCDADATLAFRTWQLAADASVFNELMKSAIVINKKEPNTLIGRSLRESLINNIPNVVVLLTEIEKRIVYADSFSGAFVQEMTKYGKANQEISQLYDEIQNIVKNNRG